MTSSITIFSYMSYAIDAINTKIVPFLFALAFIFYLYNIYNFFIQNGSDPKSVEKGRAFAIWGVVGFFVMLSVWGLVNILINTFYLSGSSRPALPTFGGSEAPLDGSGTKTYSNQDIQNDINFFNQPSATTNPTPSNAAAPVSNPTTQTQSTKSPFSDGTDGQPTIVSPSDQ